MDKIQRLARTMKTNSEDWHTADAETRKKLADDNYALGKQIEAELKNTDPTAVVERDSNGVWYVTTMGKRMKLFDEFAHLDVYHSGGIVGGFGTARQDETFAKLQNGEMVLTGQQQNKLFRVLDDQETIFTKLSAIFSPTSSYAGLLSRMKDAVVGDSSAIGSGDGCDVINVSPNINITVEKMSSQMDVAQLSKKISDNTIDSILDAFAKRGKRYGSIALLKS